MALKVVWTETAFANLEDIVSYLSQTSPDTAERVGTAILDHIEILKSSPELALVIRKTLANESERSPRGNTGFCTESMNPGPSSKS
jgi:plasmid stabilization system protein ParE